MPYDTAPFSNTEVSPMQSIALSQGQVVLVDDQDYPLLSEFRWCYRAERDGKQGYAVRHSKITGKDRLVYLHRQIVQPGEGQEVIFLNHDRLDCRRANLRVVSKQEARQHHRVRSDSKSGVKGVRYNPETDSWSAYTYRNGHCYHVGTYYSQEQAERAYEEQVRNENPDLHAAPARVERSSIPVIEQRDNPEGSCSSKTR
jgi:hypothetical protein